MYNFIFIHVFKFLIICYIILYKIFFSVYKPYIYLGLVFLSFIFFILIAVAYFTLLERKKLASIQNRSGPQRIGGGFLQPFADGLKLFLKETIIPYNSYPVVFFLSSVYALFLGLSFFIVLPFSSLYVLSNLNYGILFVFIISIFHVYSIILAGWSSNSRYSFIGGLRASAQLIAYDISLVMILLHILLYTKSLNIYKIVEFQVNYIWFGGLFPILFIIFFICSLAELNRHPFDLPEAESESVAGYNVEYSAISFSLFFLGEYAAMLFMSAFTVNLFLGGWSFFNLKFLPDLILKTCGYIFYFLKILLIIYLYINIRAAIPRYRYDQLMALGWKYLLPIVLASFVFNAVIVYFFFPFSGYYIPIKKII
jgi:NADH-quinone oxidoreductase subunit H